MNLDEANRMLESVLDMYTQRRLGLADAIANTQSTYRSEDLARMVNEIAEVEGSAEAIAVVQKVLSYNERMNDVIVVSWQERLIERLAQGPEDTWSGRTNDVKRAWFDGFRKQASRLMGL